MELEKKREPNSLAFSIRETAIVLLEWKSNAKVEWQLFKIFFVRDQKNLLVQEEERLYTSFHIIRVLCLMNNTHTMIFEDESWMRFKGRRAFPSLIYQLDCPNDLKTVGEQWIGRKERLWGWEDICLHSYYNNFCYALSRQKHRLMRGSTFRKEKWKKNSFISHPVSSIKVSHWHLKGAIEEEVRLEQRHLKACGKINLMWVKLCSHGITD